MKVTAILQKLFFCTVLSLFVMEVPLVHDARAQDAAAPKGNLEVDVEAALSERAIGDPAAPIIVYEYSSLTCPHCANFHQNILPEIREKFIDTGKVYWIFKDYPLDVNAMQATLLVRCAPQERYFEIVQALFADQKSWVTSDNVPVALARIGMKHDLPPQKYEACLNNEDISSEVYKGMRSASQLWQIKATPTFIFNEGDEKIEGDLPYEEFAEVINGFLAD